MHRSGIFRLASLLTACLLTAAALISCGPTYTADNPAFDQARLNGELANEGFKRSQRFVDGWLSRADTTTGLIPVNLDDERDIWNPEDAAADNYPFMVLTAAMSNYPRFQGRMRQMLHTEKELTSRLGSLPDTYSFVEDDFVSPSPNLDDIIFRAQEYVKDGLVPITEWLGPNNPWTDRMLDIVDDLWTRAPVDTKYGTILSRSHEINGEALQTLPRLYWMTGEKKYLDRAIRLGDYYLLGDHHPTRDAEELRLIDHGSEIISGLTELYATVAFARPEKKEAYRDPIHVMLDRVLEVGGNEHGMLYDAVNPQTGEVIDDEIVHSWGYVYNGFYTVYQIDSTEAYRRAVRHAIGSLNDHYSAYGWKHTVGGDADAIESAINLYNREPVSSTADWLDTEIKVMWGKQNPRTGIFEGWHGDGNVARTTLMYSLWKTKGLTARPWREDVSFGAVREDDALLISISSASEWRGELLFDQPRHETYMNLPFDWTRINQFPEWFTVRPEDMYTIRDLTAGTTITRSGRELIGGLELHLAGGSCHRLILRPNAR